MAKPLKVWNGTEWVEVAAQLVDTSSLLSAATASATYVDKAIVDAKADLITATADNTPARLAVGSNGQMLMADSSATAGLRYVDPPTNRSLIYNGAMQIHQRGTSSTGITSSGYYTADRWNFNLGTLGTWTTTIETDAPTGSGFSKSAKILCTTADNSPAAGDIMVWQQFLEGQDLQRIKKGTASAEQLTVSFWVKSNVTGTYIVELRDADNSRTISASYSVSASATWENKTVTFPADTTGALDNDNARSLDLNFWLGAGTNFTSGTLATTWASATNANRAVGQTNLAAATNNYWQVTGVQLETGPVATPFEFEPYEATLRKCQRYYYVHADGIYKVVGMAAIYDATELWMTVSFPVPMRTAPTANNTTGGSYFAAYRNGGIDVFNSLTVGSATTNYAAWLTNDTEISSTAGHAAYVQTNNSAARVAFSAEL